jgi:hypothetical protein
MNSDMTREVPMPTKMMSVILALSFALLLVACSPADEPDVDAPGDDPSTGLRLAPGLYDLEDGRVQAVGTLEWVDLEGGFWAVTDGTAAGDEGGNVAVIANGDELDDELSALDGRTVSVIGERFDGASIRMAGPEIIAETVEEIDDTQGAAE